MSNRFIPNSFQVPNAVVDELIAELSGAELKCYLYVIRKTKGWGKESDAISISQFMEALKIGSNNTVISACKSLVERGLLVEKTGPRGVKIYAIDWCNICTSAETAPVQKVHSTHAETAQVPVQKVHTQKNNIKNTLKNTNKKTTQKNPEPSAETPQAPPKKQTHTFDAERVNLPPFVNRDVWIKFVQHRKAIRKPIATQYTVDLLVESLEKHSLGDEATATAMLNQSCERGWTGVFALKADFAQKPTATSRPNAHSGFEQRHYGETVMPSWAKDVAGGGDA